MLNRMISDEVILFWAITADQAIPLLEYLNQRQCATADGHSNSRAHKWFKKQS
jgi:hypothetical protein